jgi:hypothetical protein
MQDCLGINAQAKRRGRRRRLRRSLATRAQDRARFQSMWVHPMAENVGAACSRLSTAILEQNAVYSITLWFLLVGAALRRRPLHGQARRPATPSPQKIQPSPRQHHLEPAERACAAAVTAPMTPPPPRWASKTEVARRRAHLGYPLDPRRGPGGRNPRPILLPDQGARLTVATKVGGALAALDLRDRLATAWAGLAGLVVHG